LPNELETAEKAVPKSPPKFAFGLGLALAQLARPARFVQAESTHRACPSRIARPLALTLSP
jgi:hypothetical protein